MKLKIISIAGSLQFLDVQGFATQSFPISDFVEGEDVNRMISSSNLKNARYAELKYRSNKPVVGKWPWNDAPVVEPQVDEDDDFEELDPQNTEPIDDQVDSDETEVDESTDTEEEDEAADEEPECVKIDPRHPPADWQWGDPTCIVPGQEEKQPDIRPYKPYNEGGDEIIEGGGDIDSSSDPIDTPTISPDYNSQNQDNYDAHHFDWKDPNAYYELFWRMFSFNNRWPNGSTKRDILFGLSDGLFMFQPRKQSTCITDGMTYFEGIFGLIKKMPEHHYYLEEQDQFNWEDITNLVMQRCNYGDSIEGVLFYNFLINSIYRLPTKWIDALFPVFIILEILDWTSIINSVVTIAYSFNVQISHLDPYNSSKVFGKLLKIVYQLWMKGYLSKRKLVTKLEKDEFLADIY